MSVWIDWPTEAGWWWQRREYPSGVVRHEVVASVCSLSGNVFVRGYCKGQCSAQVYFARLDGPPPFVAYPEPKLTAHPEADPGDEDRRAAL